MPKLLISDKKGKISTDTRLMAAGMEGGIMLNLGGSDLIKLPAGSRLFMLPSRHAISFDQGSGELIASDDSYAVAAFLAPGYTATYSTAYIEAGKPAQLPLFSYAAVCEYKGEFYTAAVRIDGDKRHDCRYIDMAMVKKNAARFSSLFPGNRLVGHLKDCALIHGCPNAQNFFLSRYEAPLPTSPSCNASCLGCISFQPGKRCPASQPRIKFVPSPEELSQVALFHMDNVKNPIVSFGQGCEGEPLLQDKLIERAIVLIRKKTAKGTVHINTNGSKPDSLARLVDAGLDSVRISLNSAREEYYLKYYKPRGYKFSDVMSSIGMAKKRGVWVSINYLTMPGFTDTVDELKALERLIGRYSPDMIQWRNLNYDPLRYFEELKVWPKKTELLGVKNIMASLKKKFPRIRMGYFNPAVRH